MVNAVILAGDSNKGAVEQEVENKSLLEINQRPMVEYVVNALREADTVGKLSIVGPVDVLRPLLEDRVDFYFHDVGSLFENARIGMEPFASDHRVLIVTSDIPMISGEAIDDFVQKSMETGCDLCYPIVDKQTNELKFPEAKRTYVKLKEGTFTGGNIFLVNPAIVDRCEKFALKLIEYRKKPWKTGRLLGLRFLIMLFAGILSIPRIESRFSEILNIKATAIISNYPELGNDVDKPSDIELVRRYMAAIRGYNRGA